jgi:hypothetical protein
MSVTVPLGTESTNSPVAGLRTGVVYLLSESIDSLATSSFAIKILHSNSRTSKTIMFTGSCQELEGKHGSASCASGEN